MGKTSRHKGLYVGASITTLDDKHRLSLGNKIAERIKEKTKSKVLYLAYREDEEDSYLRVLNLYDEDYFLENQDEIHAGFLEEITLQTNDRIQIPMTFYQYLGFSKEHRFALVVADSSASYYRLYNLAMIAANLPEHDEFGKRLPSFIEMNASCDKKLYKYLNGLAYSPQGGYRPGYEWLAQRLMIIQQKTDMAQIHPLAPQNTGSRVKPQSPPPFHPSPLFESNGQKKLGNTIKFPFE